MAIINTTLYMFASKSRRNPFRNRPQALRTLARPTTSAGRRPPSPQHGKVAGRGNPAKTVNDFRGESIPFRRRSARFRRRTVGWDRSIRLTRHFDGGTVLRWAGGAEGRGALLAGDITQVVPDRKHVSFRYSYPNYIPLPASAVERVTRAVGPFEYDRVYGAFWGMVIDRDGKAVVKRSAERYLRAIGG